MTSDTSRDTVYGPWFVAGMLLLCGIAWLLCHPYQGIFHDANLYTLQALAHLHPALHEDVFLRFGSQDRFTVFSPLYATAIQWLGIDRAAALLTLLSQAALIGGAYAVVRAAASVQTALLGLLVFLAIPGEYGPERVFTCLEAFLTPRMLSEALVLGAIAFTLYGKTRLAWLIALMAMSVHPVMGLAGCMALLTLQYILPKPRNALILAALAGAALLGSLLPSLGGRFDDAWAALVHERSPYLFMRDWLMDDWSQAGVVVTTLLIGSITLQANSRQLCSAALIVSLSGWVITVIGADWLHGVLATQVQSWRWQWLGTTVAALLLPAIVMHGWRGGTTERTCALLVLCAWIFGEGNYAAVTCAAALLVLATRRLPSRQQMLIFYGVVSLLVIALVWRIATNLEFTNLHYLDGALPLWLRRAESFTKDGLAIAAAGALLYYAASRSRPLYSLLAVLGIIAAVAIAPYSWRAWTLQDSSADTAAAFSSWRDLVPATAEIFWPEATHETWTLLHRPSYISGLQTSGLVYSRPAAIELARRAESLSGVVPPAAFLEWSHIGLTLPLSIAQLEQACSLAVFPYLVTGASLNAPLLGELHNDTKHAQRALRLYRCDKQES
jgi:hypothetical protein